MVLFSILSSAGLFLVNTSEWVYLDTYWNFAEGRPSIEPWKP